jgi:hypothetical protein
MLQRADIADFVTEPAKVRAVVPAPAPAVVPATVKDRLAVGLFVLAIAATFLWLLLAATGNFSEPVTFGSLAFRPAAFGSCV